MERSSQILNTNDFAEMFKKFYNFHRKGSWVKYCLSLMPSESTQLLCTQDSVTQFFSSQAWKTCSYDIFLSSYCWYSYIYQENVRVHMPFFCMTKRELLCFVSQNLLWQWQIIYWIVWEEIQELHELDLGSFLTGCEEFLIVGNIRLTWDATCPCLELSETLRINATGSQFIA